MVAGAEAGATAVPGSGPLVEHRFEVWRVDGAVEPLLDRRRVGRHDPLAQGGRDRAEALLYQAEQRLGFSLGFAFRLAFGQPLPLVLWNSRSRYK